MRPGVIIIYGCHERIKIMNNYVYILKCRDGSLYTGWTNDIDKRLAAHNSGNGAKYTRGRRPVVLVHLEELPSKEAALSREWEIKHLSTVRKWQLVSGDMPDNCARGKKEPE